MSRYIDADKLTFSRVRIIHPDGTAGGWNAVVMSSVINNTPTADVVEVVRCKDCKRCKKFKRVDGTYFFSCRSGCFKEVVSAEHYCSYGERREE